MYYIQLYNNQRKILYLISVRIKKVICCQFRNKVIIDMKMFKIIEFKKRLIINAEKCLQYNDTYFNNHKEFEKKIKSITGSKDI